MEMGESMLENFINVILLSMTAGLATGLGGLLVVLKKPGEKSFGFLGGFAAGVMIVLSFLGLILKAWNEMGYLIASLGFSLGALTMFLLDLSIPHMRFSVKEDSRLIDSKLMKGGMMMAVGVTLHNFPEGISLGAGYAHAPSFGLLIAIAIGLHNIPEGIATALPIYSSGGKKLKAVKVSFLSGLVEPVGATLAFLFLSSYTSLIPITLAFAAGVMVFITLDELVPMCHSHGHDHSTALGIIFGSILMLLLLGIFGV